jgi:nitrogen fixation/metabolism regulation signal transduction histidine kinase
MQARFSIRYKFLLVATGLIVLSVGTYLWLATYIFREDKRALVYDYNRSFVNRTAAEFELAIRSVQDQMRLAAYFYAERARSRTMITDLLKKNPDVVFVGLSKNFNKLDHAIYSNDEFLKTYGITLEIFTGAQKAMTVPFQKLQEQSEALWSIVPEGAPKLLGIAKTVIREDARGVPFEQFAVVAFLKTDRLERALKSSQTISSSIVTAEGDLLLDSEDQSAKELKASLEKIFKKARSSQLVTEVTRIEVKGDALLGAYAKTLGGRAVVLSSVEERRAFYAVNQLVYRSIIFATMLITLAFIVAVFFSRSITRPLEVLMGGIQEVSSGNLGTQIHVRSRDEISVLANSFNRMIRDLKESRAELESINRDLEGKVSERTKELEERNQAVKEAQEALLRSTRLAAVGEVAGLAAHEVLNPLTSIVSRLSELKKRVEAQKENEAQFLLNLKKSWQDDFKEGGFEKLLETWKAPSQIKPGALIWDEDLGNIEQIGQTIQNEYDSLIRDADFLLTESQRVGRIVNSFRSLNSVNAEVRRHKLSDLCERSIEVMLDLAKKNNTRLTVDFKTKDLYALVGEDEVIQVLTNLIRNAVQSIAALKIPGEIKVTMYEEAGCAKISVRDNGGGVKKEHRDKLFEKQFTTKSRSEGTGIGLSISRRLIRAFKGDLVLNWAEENKGAEFLVTIPLVAQSGTRNSGNKKGEVKSA